MNRTRILAPAAIATGTLLTAAALPAGAAPLTYQQAVIADNPFAYFRQQETGITTGAIATDFSTNGRNGSYVGSPTGGVAGAVAPGSDAAVRYAGSASGTATQYFGGSGLQSLGGSLANSSFEFVFKTNPDLPTGKQSLFGVFNTGNTTAAEVTLNSQGNDALADAPNTTRLYIRGDDGDGVGVHFTNAAIYDGNYHHLVFTFDRSTLVAEDADDTGPTPPTFSGGFAAYVDGVAQELTYTLVNRGAADSNVGPDTFANFAFDPTFLARNVRTTLGGTAVARQANVTLDEAVLYTTTLSATRVEAHAAAVPEPGALALAGVAGLGLMVRRRRRA